MNEQIKDQQRQKRIQALQNMQEDIVLSKKSYKERMIENKQKRRGEEEKIKEKKEKIQERKKDNRFQKIPIQFKSRWDVNKTERVINEQESIRSQTQNIPNLLTTNWDQPSDNNSLKQIQTPKTILSQLQEDKSTQEYITHTRYLTDKELDEILPSEGFQIIKPPSSYKGQKFTRDTNGKDQEYVMPEQKINGEELPAMNQSDLKYFGNLLKQKKQLSRQDKIEYEVMTLILKIKNGTSILRKQALKKIIERCEIFGAELLLKKVLPLILDSSIDEIERHQMVKLLDKIIFKLDKEIRPYFLKILTVIQPMLISEDYFIRIEGREIVSNLIKSVGLATTLTSLRLEIENPNEDIREITAQTLAIGATALTLPKFLPFIQAVCKSKKSQKARLMGTKIIYYLAKMTGASLLPHLRQLILCLKNLLKDDEYYNRISCAQSLSMLAEVCKPYGIEAFDVVIKDLWRGVTQNKGRTMIAFLKAIGNIIPLMDETHGNKYTNLVLKIIKKYLNTPEDELKKAILKILFEAFKRTEIDKQYVHDYIFEDYWKNFWTRRMCLDRGASFRIIETTTELCSVVGVSKNIKQLIQFLKEDNDNMRQITMSTIKSIMDKYGTSEINHKLEELLVDASLFAIHQSNNDDQKIILNGFSSVINALGIRSQKYISQIFVNICIRLKTKNPQIREQTATLIGKLAHVFGLCEGMSILRKLSQILYENLGEEYPDVLGQILWSLGQIIQELTVEFLIPPVSDLLPSLTPILKNTNPKVQKHLATLIKVIAEDEQSSEDVQPKEWIRICMDLLDLFKAQDKKIRQIAIDTFGSIAKAIGPQDVLVTLINNLKVQDRQTRICTSIAIAVIAKECGPFTVLPALMNEYRVPLNHVQNGILKTLGFIFQHVGDMSKDYIYSLTPLLEHALVSKDIVHKQIATNSFKNLALGIFSYQREEYLIHLFNFILPNIFESSPHIKTGVIEAFEAFRLSVGPGYALMYIIQGLFHAAQKVRNIYWGFYNNLQNGAQDALVPYYPILQKNKEVQKTQVQENFYIL